MRLRTRIERLERDARPAAWWDALEDCVLPAPECYFLSNAVDWWRAVMGLEPISEHLRRYKGLPPLDAEREERLRWLTAREVNAWAVAQGAPAVPLTDIFEDANAAGHYVMSHHFRPITALGYYACCMLRTPEEEAEVRAKLDAH